MKFSLLYKDYSDETVIEDEHLLDEMSGTLYALSVDKALSAFCKSGESIALFMEILKKPLRRAETIKYRQDIMLDFIAAPKLLEDLKLIFKSYDTLQADWHEMRSSIYMYGVPGTVRGILDSTYESLKVTAGFTRNTVSYFRSIQETIEKYDVKAEGLIGIKSFCAEMTENESLDEISEIASYFQRESIDAYEFRLRLETDDTLVVGDSSLTEAFETETRSLGNSIKKLFGSIGKERESVPEIDLGQFHLEDAQNMLSEALYEVYAVLSGITGNIYEFFRGLSGELSFYDTALSYCRWLTRANMPMCMPHMLAASEDSFKANELYDMQLLLEGLASQEIVTNTVRIDKDSDGILIRGGNTSGKTSYLRAIGTAQLFSQAGLPVCASNAAISIRNGLFAQFSSAEKEFFTGDVAGRFEGEVQDVARIFDSLVPYSLVLLNETFQTTAYGEGAEGMRHILEALPEMNTKYIFVTRLITLFDSLDANRVKFIEMSEGYKGVEF